MLLNFTNVKYAAVGDFTPTEKLFIVLLLNSSNRNWGYYETHN